jgi:hypothetical protein
MTISATVSKQAMRRSLIRYLPVVPRRSAMITKENRVYRNIFFRDHEKNSKMQANLLARLGPLRPLVRM